LALVFFIMEKIITALEPQKNNPDRVNVYIDNQFAFGVSRFVGAWLKEGQVLEESSIEKLLDQDNHERAFQRALRFLAFQPRTEKEIHSKLRELGFEEIIIEAVIGELTQKKYLDDARFAQDWIESRSGSKPRSHRFFAYELKRKGIPQEMIDQSLQNAPAEDVLALSLGEKYLNRFENLGEEDFKRKMYGVLGRRAFTYETIKKTIDKLIQMRRKK